MPTKCCSQCSATVEVDEDTLATQCRFCDSPLVDTSAEQPTIDRVVPFEIKKTRAGRLLSDYLAGKWLAPQAIRKATKPGGVQGVYVPFFAYDATVRSGFSARVGIYWYRTETYTTVVNGKTVVRTRRVQETEWFPFSGSHVRDWVDHLVSASTGLPEIEANALEPYDLGRSAPYAPARIAGWAAEYPTVNRTDAQKTANQELANLGAQVIQQGHLPGDTYSGFESSSDIDVGDIELIMLPVWIATYTFGGSNVLRLLVNGQTGEVVGDVPRSKTKIAAIIGSGLAIVLGFVGLAVLLSGGG